MRRHGLPTPAVSVGAAGTFPTFLVGSYVVKLFPRRFGGAACFAIERSLHSGPLDRPDLPVPRYVAHGQLFESGWRWPYLVTTRLDGTPWSEASLPAEAQLAVAAQLGEVLRRVHALDCPDGPVWRRDLLGELRASCAARHHRRRMLPPGLIDQIDAYLAPPSPVRRLVHADLHADHILVDGARLVGLIDWGDALCGDPYYELPSLYFGTFRPLLRAFLDAYGWRVGPDFAQRAMSMTLVHEFNPARPFLPPLDRVPSLDDLAARLWQL
jgi:aminoglycoside phosphotransferase